MQFLLSGVHGIDYLFFHFLLGATIFRWAIVSAGGREGEASDPNWFSRWRALLWLTFISSLAWMILTSADMGESWLPKDLWQAMAHTWFGHLWCIRILLLFLLAIAAQWIQPNAKQLFFVTFCLIAATLISSLSGHAASQETGVWWRVSLDLTHSLAAGVWSGGILCLYFWLGTRIDREDRGKNLSQAVVHRFSKVAMTSTGLLLLTGLVMAWDSGVSLYRPWNATYGQFIIGKTIFFAIALGAAAINQFVHMRRPAETESKFAENLRREVRLEIFCVVVVFLIAGFLTRTSLPIEGLMP